MKSDLKKLLSATFPVMMGYIPLGMAFGFLFQQQGAPWWLAVLSSVFVYAGAAQYMSIALLASHAPLWTIASATLFINLRHIFYGMSLLDAVPAQLGKRLYFIFGITDETYSLLTTTGREHDADFRFWLVALNQCYWIAGTLLGALLGGIVSEPVPGVEFSLVALFAVLAVEQAYQVQRAMPFVVGAGALLVAALVAPQNLLPISIALVLIIETVYFKTAGHSLNTAETSVSPSSETDVERKMP